MIEYILNPDKSKNSPWYPGTNGCPIIGSDKLLVQRLTTDRQTDGRTKDKTRL